MKKIIIGIVFSFLIFNLYSIPPRDNKTGSVIGIQVSVSGLFAPQVFNGIVFVKLKNGNDFTSGEKVVLSKSRSGFNIYLYNVEPGTYVAVGGSYTSGGGHDSVVFFSTEMVAKTKIVVKSNSITYMGKYTVSTGKHVKDKGDKVQRHYGTNVDSAYPPYVGKIKRSSNTEKDKEAFMKSTIRLLKKSEWSDLVG
ncbi:MAG: hypothetical protein ABUK01_04045 [Leptospirales bacterium]